jgi:hypothetical protein
MVVSREAKPLAGTVAVSTNWNGTKTKTNKQTNKTKQTMKYIHR